MMRRKSVTKTICHNLAWGGGYWNSVRKKQENLHRLIQKLSILFLGFFCFCGFSIHAKENSSVNLTKAITLPKYSTIPSGTVLPEGTIIPAGASHSPVKTTVPEYEGGEIKQKTKWPNFGYNSTVSSDSKLTMEAKVMGEPVTLLGDMVVGDAITLPEGTQLMSGTIVIAHVGTSDTVEVTADLTVYAGTVLKAGSVINGTRYSKDTTLTETTEIKENSSKNNSKIAKGSSLVIVEPTESGPTGEVEIENQQQGLTLKFTKTFTPLSENSIDPVIDFLSDKQENIKTFFKSAFKLVRYDLKENNGSYVKDEAEKKSIIF